MAVLGLHTQTAVSVTGEGEVARGRQGRHHANTWPRPWPNGPWHVARTPALTSFTTAADLNACCLTSSLVGSGDGRVRGTASASGQWWTKEVW
jgi:hypothetical protein